MSVELQSECDMQRKCKKVKKCRRISLGMALLQKGFGELIGTLAVGLLAVNAQAIATAAGAPLGAYGVGAGFGIIAMAAGLIFSQFGTVHLASHITIASFLCDEGASGRGAERGWAHLVIFLTTIVGWLAAAGLSILLLPTPPFNRDLGFTVPLPAIADSFLIVFIFELLGKMLLDHVFLFSAQAYKGVWGVVGGSVLLGGLVAILGPLTGGSLNFWRSFWIHLVEGQLGLLPIAAHIVSEIVAPLLTAIIKCFLYPAARY